MTVATERAIQILADGQWHQYEKVVWEVAKAVPPQVAINRTEAIRIARYLQCHPGEGLTKKDVPPRKRPATHDTLIRVGATAIATDIVRNKRFQNAKDPAGTKWIRLIDINKPDPPLPNGWTFWMRRNRGKWINLPPEEQKKLRTERSRLASIKRLEKLGIVVDENYETHDQRAARKRREWEALPPEERARIRREIHQKGVRTRLTRLGIDPDTFVSKREREEQRKAAYAALSEEEKKRRRRAAQRKAWETRRANQAKREEEGNG